MAARPKTFAGPPPSPLCLDFHMPVVLTLSTTRNFRPIQSPPPPTGQLPKNATTYAEIRESHAPEGNFAMAERRIRRETTGRQN